MTKQKKLHTLPFVSICTPTFNRRPFIPYAIKCFEHQTYPKNKMEWVIIDDGTDPIKDLVCHIPEVKYVYSEEKMKLGKKRNFMHKKCKGDIIIYMDDDDYYPPERVSHAVKMLQDNPSYLIAGSSLMCIYFKHINQMYQFGPYKENHSTAATFAFRKELLNQTKYADTSLAEEKSFLKNYTIPLLQLDVTKTILVISHCHGTYNKKELLNDLIENVGQESELTVDNFIKEQELKDFYMSDVDEILKSYEPGRIENKPLVLKQLNEMKNKRDKIRKEYAEEYKKEADYLKIMSLFNANSQPQQSLIEFENLKNEYEKKLADKSILINELLKKIKELTKELNEYKK